MPRDVLSYFEKMPGNLLIFFGALLWSTAGGVIKSFELDEFLLPAVRALLAGVVLLPFLRPRQIVWDRYLLGMILTYAGLSFSILIALRYTTAANAIALQFTAPIWIFFWDLCVQRRLPSLRRLLPLICMALGVGIILLEPKSGSSLAGNLLALLAGLSFAGISRFLPRVRAGGGLSTIALINLCAGTLMFLPQLLLPNCSVHVPLNVWPYLLYLSVFQLSAGYVFYYAGLRKVSTQKATILSTWELVLTPVWAFLLVGELPTLYGAVGWLVLLAAVMLENLLVHERPAEARAS